jgi:carboxyl-terminal processing protease
MERRPLIGSGVVGYFVSPDSVRTSWEMERIATAPLAPPLAHSRPAAAVLHDSVTASSGEAVVVAFRGRPATRTFGQSTRGLSTANRTNVLPDGSKLMVTTSVFADRTGRLYGGRILPDQELSPDIGESALLEVVATWIQAQPACGAQRA